MRFCMTEMHLMRRLGRWLIEEGVRNEDRVLKGWGESLKRFSCWHGHRKFQRFFNHLKIYLACLTAKLSLIFKFFPSPRDFQENS